MSGLHRPYLGDALEQGALPGSSIWLAVEVSGAIRRANEILHHHS